MCLHTFTLRSERLDTENNRNHHSLLSRAFVIPFLSLPCHPPLPPGHCLLLVSRLPPPCQVGLGQFSFPWDIAQACDFWHSLGGLEPARCRVLSCVVAWLGGGTVTFISLFFSSPRSFFTLLHISLLCKPQHPLMLAANTSSAVSVILLLCNRLGPASKLETSTSCTFVHAPVMHAAVCVLHSSVRGIVDLRSLSRSYNKDTLQL